jgi:hypothetical protein
MPGFAGNPYHYRFLFGIPTGCFVSQGVFHLVTTVSDRNDSVYQVLLQMLFNHTFSLCKSGLQLESPYFQIIGPGHEKVHVAVDQSGRNGASGHVNQTRPGGIL